jgi:predicted dehydrogenase
VGRRQLLAGAAAAATFHVLPAPLVKGSQTNSAITIGLIGCGGRGGWIADLFAKTGKYRLVACADYFPDRVEACAARFQVPADRRFTGLSAYKRLLDQELDAVVIETPPYCHPEQAAAAVQAGKHVFVAKPIAVDVPGCLSIAESGRRATAAKKVFLVDFQTRANDIYRETLRRVRQGAIGKLVSAEAHYPWSGNVHDRPALTPEERLRYWYQTLALCGDVIVEQDIHALDVLTWFAGADPIRATGTGGRAVRKHGNIWDQFAVTYWFPNDFVATFTSQKAVPGVRDEIRCRVFGTDGVADTDYMGEVNIRGKNPYEGGRMTGLYTNGAQRNIDEFYDCVTRGHCENPTVAPSVRSNLTCVLGRTAAYRGCEVTWKDMMTECERLEPDLSGLKA